MKDKLEEILACLIVPFFVFGILVYALFKRRDPEMPWSRPDRY